MHIFAISGKTYFMINFKEKLKELFLYKPEVSYDFVLAENNASTNNTDVPPSFLPDEDIFSSLDKNYDYLKVQYNTLINSDVLLRPFIVNIAGKNYNSLLIGIDGMISSPLVNNFLLRPLMNTNIFSSKKTSRMKNGVEFKKIKKINVEDYIFDKLIPQTSVKKVSKFSDVSKSVSSGDCALFVDTLNIAFVIDVKGFESRSIEKPQNEIVVRGSQEAFVEKLRTNTSILRRLINSPDLIIENSSVGTISKTSVAVCYMKNIANSSLVAEVKYRLNSIDVDYVVSSGNVEQLIQDNSKVAFPQMISTERPDKATHHLLEGRVVIIVNGSPYVLIVPGVFIDFLSSPEDFNLKHQYSNLLKVLRFIATFITLFLSGIYVAIMCYHTELVPTALLFTIAASRNAVPFPIIFELLLMEVSFELIREAGLRIPTPIGPTIGIIGALVLGDAAVSANLVSPVLIVLVALTGLCSFAIPDYSLNFTFRIYKFLYIFLGYIAGLLGIAVGMFTQVTLLCNLRSFGASYFAPYAPLTNLKTSVSYLLHPIWRRETRSDFLNTKRPREQPHISMKWQLWKNKFNK